MKVLVAGIGNIFLGDDGFGCEVARRMSTRPVGPGVRVQDFGIRSFDLALALLDSVDLTILVDAVSHGSEPGTLYTIEPTLDVPLAVPSAPADMHRMDPEQVLRLVQTLGGNSGRILLVGCEPADFGDECEGRMGLSEPVAAAVEPAIRMVEKLIHLAFLKEAA